MRLTAGLDSGPVCLSGVERISALDSYGSLAARLQELGAELLLRALREAPPFREQPEDGVTYAEKIGAQDRLLDPQRPARELERVVRALHPHIGARVAIADGELLGVHRAALLADADAQALPWAAGSEPGVHICNARVLLGCSVGVLELLEVQPAGGRAMDAAA